jgi:RNA polymerase sigma-70 factor (ECF subfamily)
MTTPPLSPSGAQPADGIQQQLAALRPRLHRYCARMAGSALDGEDIVQDTLIKATEHYDAQTVRHLEAWLFRIAHNTAMDFLRRKALEKTVFVDEPADSAEGQAGDFAEDTASQPDNAHEVATLALRTFVRLPIAQRSAVILADVLGYALLEAADIVGASLQATKAALHRGRVRLRELAAQPDEAAPAALSASDQALVAAYAARFNARDFDGLRDMLAEEARLDLVARHRVQGRAAVSNYFGNYSGLKGVRVQPGSLEGHGGLWVYEGAASGAAEDAPAYFVALAWQGGKLLAIRDFRYARYATEVMLLN